MDLVLPGRGMSWKAFLRRLKEEYRRDGISDVAGALTFFGVLALFPFLLFMIALASLVIDPLTAQSLVDQLARVAPGEVTQILGERIRALGEQRSVGLLTFGAAAAFYSASRGILAAIRSLNLVYGVKETRPGWKVYGIAFLMTLGTAFLAILAALIAVGTPVVARWVGEPVGTVLLWLRLPVAALLMLVVWATLYYVLPDVEQRFRFITLGSLVGVAVWVLASLGFSFYVARFGNFDATYGALGGVIVLLLWMWISAQVLLLGAEINSIVETSSPGGKGAGAHRMGEPAPKATKSEVERAGGALESMPPGAALQERLELSARRKPQRRRSGGWALIGVGLAALVGLLRLSRR